MNNVKENLTYCQQNNDNLKKQIKTIQRNFEIYLSEKFNKNLKCKIKNNHNIYNNMNLNKIDNDSINTSTNQIENFIEFIQINNNNFNSCKKFFNEINDLNPISKNLNQIILSEIEYNYIELHSKLLELNQKLNLAELYHESKYLLNLKFFPFFYIFYFQHLEYFKIHNLYEQVCRQKREKENVITELESRIKYLESSYNSVFNNRSSNNRNKENNLNNNLFVTYNNNNNSNNISNSNNSDNILTNKDDKYNNLTFNYNMLNKTITTNSANTANCGESIDQQQSMVTKKNSHISGFKYDKGNSYSFDSLLNNSKNNIKNVISNNDFITNNIYLNREYSSKNIYISNLKNNNSFYKKDINNTNSLVGLDNILIGNLEENLGDTLTLNIINFSNNLINNIDKNKNVVKLNSNTSLSHSRENSDSNNIKNKSYREEKGREYTKVLCNTKTNKLINENKAFTQNIDIEDEINFKNLNSTSIDLINIMKKEQISLEEKKNSFDDLDDISFPDKVKMRSISVYNQIPRLKLNFQNKSVDFRKKKNDNKKYNFSKDSYMIDLNNTSLIINEKFRYVFYQLNKYFLILFIYLKINF